LAAHLKEYKSTSLEKLDKDMELVKIWALYPLDD